MLYLHLPWVSNEAFVTVDYEQCFQEGGEGREVDTTIS